MPMRNSPPIQSAMANAAPQNTSATVTIAVFDERRPKKPLIAAPASGSSGISQNDRGSAS